MVRAHFICLIALLFYGASFCFLPITFAATTVSDAYDQPSSHKISRTSNHKFFITTSEQIDEAETLTLIFPSSFDTSSIVENDVDIADDGVDLTTAVDCTGSEQASIVVASDIITVTICVGDGGAIASASLVTVEIGTNASSSGSGVNKITNPSSAGTYFAGIAGTSGMSGSLPLPIISDDDSGVSAIVSSGDGGGGGAGGGDSDNNDSGDDTDDTTDDDTIDDSIGDIVDDTTDDQTDDTTIDDLADDSGIDDISSDNGADEVVDGNETNSSSGDSGDSSNTDATSGGDDSGSSDGDTNDSSSIGENNGLTSNFDVEIIVADNEISLSGDEIDTLAGTPAIIRVKINESDEVKSIHVSLADSTYTLVESTLGVYESEILLPVFDALVSIDLSYENGGTKTQTLHVDAKNHGQVYEILDNERVPVEGAILIVYESGGEQWNAKSFGQENPRQADENGFFSWYVPNGTYIVTAGKSGYEDAQISVDVQNNILSPNIELIRMPIIQIKEELPIEQIQANITSVILVATAVIASIIQTIDEIRALPEVQAVADVAIPVTLATAVTSAGVLSSSFNLLTLLRYLFSSPILFFARRKRKEFGTIYNAITKIPIDLAIVRLLNRSEKIVKTMITDKEGRYFFSVQPGEYVITVTKPGFLFPSDYLSGKKVDGRFLDVYTGGLIEVTDKNVLVGANIPLDPSQDIKLSTPKRLIIERFLRMFQHLLALSGIILAIAVNIIAPTFFTLSLLGVHIVVYLITRIVVKPRRKKGWGVVSAEKTSYPIPNAVVRLFEPKYNKLVESTLTDGKGRYAFLAGPNEYFATFEKDGFEKGEVRPIDYSQNAEPKVISINVKLKSVI